MFGSAAASSRPFWIAPPFFRSSSTPALGASESANISPNDWPDGATRAANGRRFISAEHLLHELERGRLRDDQLTQPRRLFGQARCGLAIRFFQLRDLLLRRLDF